MTKINKGGSAFPVLGMTLRDYFAAKAMQIALTEISNSDSIENHLTLIANTSYIVADAMVKAREESDD